MSLSAPHDPVSNLERTEESSNNIVIRRGYNNFLTFLILAVAITIASLSVYIGAYHRSPADNPSADGIQVLSPHALIPHTNAGDITHGLRRLEPHVSFKAINEFFTQDSKRQVHSETRFRVLSQIKVWIDGVGRLQPFVSLKAINELFIQDQKRRVRPGTRERVLSQIKAWIDNPNTTERILWLHGPAGVGKSTIAQTITHSYTTEKVPANFFFFRSDSDRNNGNRLFTTIAWQFASSIPDIKGHIARSLDEQPDLPTKDVETQFQQLIVRPLEALSNDTRQHRLSDMVVVINGMDECVDEHLQERILKVIGNVATNIRVPLRFFISSRSEAHINNTISSFQRRALSINLAECADTDRDIEKYLKNKFFDIAKQHGIDAAIWPGQKRIQQLVTKTSGQFLYASTVIKFVGAEGDNAEAQLDTILDLKPRTAIQTFAELDRLYIEILERQPDQEFLKTFLPSLVAQDSISIFRPSSHKAACFYPHLRGGYEILMDVSKEGLRNKLSKMGSLLRSTPDNIGVHHRSFLEFLQDASRSGQYNISTQSAARQHLLLIIDSLVRSASKSLAIEQPDYYPPVTELVEIFGRYRTSFDNLLSREDWREALRPLLNFQERLLDSPNFTLPPNECTIFHVVHRLLLSISYRQLFLDTPKENHGAVMSSVLNPDLRGGLSSVPTYFRRLKGMFDLMNTLLHVEPEVIAMRVRSWSEAQNLMDLIYHIVNGKYLLTSLLNADVARKATQLALEIHTRIPVLPRLLLSTAYTAGSYSTRSCRSCDLEALARVWLISNVLDHRYILPVLRIDVSSVRGAPPITLVSDDIGSIQHWRESKSPSSDEIIYVMLKLAGAIQYLHSIGIVLSDTIDLDDIYVDSKFRVRISPMELVWSVHGRSLQDVGQRYQTDINSFGRFFCMMYFDTEPPCSTDTRTSPYKPGSDVSGESGDVPRQLIERCLSAEGKPSINEVVQEIESWKVE